MKKNIWHDNYDHPGSWQAGIRMGLAILAVNLVLLYQEHEQNKKWHSIPAVHDLDCKYESIKHQIDSTYKLKYDSLKKVYRYK